MHPRGSNYYKPSASPDWVPKDDDDDQDSDDQESGLAARNHTPPREPQTTGLPPHAPRPPRLHNDPFNPSRNRNELRFRYEDYLEDGEGPSTEARAPQSLNEDGIDERAVDHPGGSEIPAPYFDHFAYLDHQHSTPRPTPVGQVGPIQPTAPRPYSLRQANVSLVTHFPFNQAANPPPIPQQPGAHDGQPLPAGDGDFAARLYCCAVLDPGLRRMFPKLGEYLVSWESGQPLNPTNLPPPVQQHAPESHQPPAHAPPHHEHWNTPTAPADFSYRPSNSQGTGHGARDLVVSAYPRQPGDIRIPPVLPGTPPLCLRLRHVDHAIDAITTAQYIQGTQHQPANPLVEYLIFPRDRYPPVYFRDVVVEPGTDMNDLREWLKGMVYFLFVGTAGRCNCGTGFRYWTFPSPTGSNLPGPLTFRRPVEIWTHLANARHNRDLPSLHRLCASLDQWLHQEQTR